MRFDFSFRGLEPDECSTFDLKIYRADARSAFQNQNLRCAIQYYRRDLRCLQESTRKHLITTATPFSVDNSEIEIEVSIPQVFQKNFHGGSSDGRHSLPRAR